MPFVYILKSEKTGNYYIGCTSNLKRRLKQHESGEGYTTRRFLPYKLVLSQEYQSIKEAQWIESKLKKLKRKDYIDKIIKDGTIKFKLRRPTIKIQGSEPRLDDL